MNRWRLGKVVLIASIVVFSSSAKAGEWCIAFLELSTADRRELVACALGRAASAWLGAPRRWREAERGSQRHDELVQADLA